MIEIISLTERCCQDGDRAMMPALVGTRE